MKNKILKNCLALILLFYSVYLEGNQTNEVIATINVGVTPDGVAITPDSLFAYVANNNNYSITGKDTVSVINLKNNLLKKTIRSSTFNEPLR
jgi:DNA-binding beta-propeller fold protein YncE